MQQNIAIHKGAEAFCLTAFMIHKQCTAKSIIKGLFIVVFASPIGLCLSFAVQFCIFPGDNLQNYHLVSIFLLLSAGSYIYVSNLYIFRSVYCDEEQSNVKENTIRQYIKMFIILSGFLTPVIASCMIPSKT